MPSYTLQQRQREGAIAIFNVLGDALVTDRELQAKHAAGDLDIFASGYRRGESGLRLAFPSGHLTMDNFITNYPDANGGRVDFVPVGIGKPLTVEIRHVYTGEHPITDLIPDGFDVDKDMVVTSAMKSLTTFNAAPRALNFFRKNVAPGHNTRTPAATEEGTPLIHYTPALVEPNSVLTLEISFEEFNKETSSAIGDAFTEAAGLPVFLPYSSYLLAAGMVTKILGDVGERLFNKPAIFNETVSLDFQRPGAFMPVADFRLVIRDDIDDIVPDFRRKYAVNAEGFLQDRDGRQYDGPIPYMVISLDGRENKAYKDFSATAVSSTVLQRFLGVGEGQQKSVGPLIDAFKVYNDWTFRQQADELKEKLSQLRALKGSPTAPEGLEADIQSTQERYDAVVANIRDKVLKPK